MCGSRVTEGERSEWQRSFLADARTFREQASDSCILRKRPLVKYQALEWLLHMLLGVLLRIHLPPELLTEVFCFLTDTFKVVEILSRNTF